MGGDRGNSRAHGYRSYHIAQRTPAVAPKTKIMSIASTIFPPARSAKHEENQAIDPQHRRKAQDFDSYIAALSRAWRLRASSAHSTEAESDSFLACAAKKKDVGAELATMHAVALNCSPR